MSGRLRDHGPTLAAAAAGVWVMTYLGLYGYGWNDYATEALPAYGALAAGRLWQFLELAPGYGGSLELRAPFALLPAVWGGGPVAVYQAVSIPCLVAAALLGAWLAGELRARGHPPLARWTALALCAANPVTLYALQLGHAEELLGGALCVAAVCCAQRGHAGWSGALLGLAIVNKQWALLAIGPVLLALPARRGRALGVAGMLCACFYAPLLAPGLVDAHHADGVAETGSGVIFQPWQLWWFLGAHGHLVRDPFGAVKVGYRTPPAWLEGIAHPLIVVLAAPLTLLAAARRHTRDPMLLLVLLLALRCALDPWDTVYYPIPFLLALVAWESLRWRRPPVLALTASVVVWLVFVVAPQRLGADAQAALFAAVAVPALAALGTALYAPGALRSRAAPATSSAVGSAPIPTL